MTRSELFGEKNFAYGAETWALKKAQEKPLQVAEMRMLRWMCHVRSCQAGQNKKWKNKRDNESGGNHKEIPGKEVEVVWGCDEQRGTLRRKEGDGNESRPLQGRKGRPKRRWLDTVKDDIKEKALSADEVYDRATWRCMSSYIDRT